MVKKSAQSDFFDGLVSLFKILMSLINLNLNESIKFLLLSYWADFWKKYILNNLNESDHLCETPR